jgi:hypothetical protein
MLRFTPRPEKELPVPIGLEAVWAPETVWELWRREKSLAPGGNLTMAVQPVARVYTKRTFNAFYS